jgi:hypothetical protein
MQAALSQLAGCDPDGTAGGTLEVRFQGKVRNKRGGLGAWDAHWTGTDSLTTAGRKNRFCA